MIEFRKDSSRTIGKAEVAGLVSIDDDLIIDVSGRRCDKPYFAVKIAIRNSIEMVPTGNAQMPETPSTDELIITDADFSWYYARHKTFEELEATGNDIDSNVYVREELPDRVANLTLADRDHILEKIESFCHDLYSSMEGDADLGEAGQDQIS